MALRIGARKKGIVQSRKRVVGQLRRAQLVTTFGCGAIVDMPDYSVMIAATDYWNSESPVLHEANLERLLNTEGFRQPYISEGRSLTGQTAAHLPQSVHSCASGFSGAFSAATDTAKTPGDVYSPSETSFAVISPPVKTIPPSAEPQSAGSLFISVPKGTE